MIATSTSSKRPVLIHLRSSTCYCGSKGHEFDLDTNGYPVRVNDHHVVVWSLCSRCLRWFRGRKGRRVERRAEEEAARYVLDLAGLGIEL